MFRWVSNRIQVFIDCLRVSHNWDEKLHAVWARRTTSTEIAQCWNAKESCGWLAESEAVNLSCTFLSNSRNVFGLHNGVYCNYCSLSATTESKICCWGRFGLRGCSTNPDQLVHSSACRTCFLSVFLSRAVAFSHRSEWNVSYVTTSEGSGSSAVQQ